MYTNIKTFAQACKALEISTAVPDASMLPNRKEQRALVAHYKLTVICRAINEGWKPNWKNVSQYKYYPWFRMDGPKGFSYYDSDYWHTLSTVGSRLCFQDSDRATYAGKTFLSLYKAAFTL